jgi:aspartate carbamoyltransferase regulatory subunit
MAHQGQTGHRGQVVIELLDDQLAHTVGTRELYEKMAIIVDGLNYCMKAVVDKGLVKINNFVNSKKIFGYVYLFTPTGMVKKIATTNIFLRNIY